MCPVGRSKVTSRKFTTCKFAPAMIFRLNCSKPLWSCFLVFSAKRADLHGRTGLEDFLGGRTRVCPTRIGGARTSRGVRAGHAPPYDFDKIMESL